MHEAPRKVRARVPSGGGLFTKGNVNTYGTSATPIATDFRARNSGFYGALPYGDLVPYKGPLKKAKAAPRHGKRCPGCGIETPLSGRCNQCWD